MLILTRKPGESLFIGDEIKVTIIEIKGNQIRIGIDAPKDQRIYREEIYLQIIEQNKEAAGMSESEGMDAPIVAGQRFDSIQTGSLQGQTASNKLVIKPVSGMNLARGKGMPVSKKDTAQDGSAAFAKLSQPVAPAVEVKRSVIKRNKNPSESES